MKTLSALIAVSLILAVAATAQANTVGSSTMYFSGNLTDAGGGVYTGVVAMIDEGGADRGFDIYARQGATAKFELGADVVIGADHDGWPAWPTDTPDWYQYSLELTSTGWALRNHPGNNSDSDPWYDNTDGDTQGPAGVPMSGSMNWTTMIASETDVGQYIPTTGTGKYPGWAAANGGGAACWDMDWSWGSEVVPLQFGDFAVEILPLGNDQYTVKMTPVPEPVTMAGLALGIGSLATYIRRRRAA